MGIFNLFKPNKKNIQPEKIDEIFELACNDVAYSSLFFRSLFESELFLLTLTDDNNLKGERLSEPNKELAIRPFRNGKIPVFTSVDRIFDNDIFKGNTTYASMIGKDLFRMFNDKSILVLNPFSKFSKEFSDEELNLLKTGKFQEAGQPKTTKEGEIIWLGLPAKYPTELVAAIKKYCETREEIKSAYLAQIQNRTKQETSHLIIGLSLTNNENAIFGEMGTIAKSFIGTGEYIDFVNVEKINSFNLREKKFHIY